MIILAKCSLGRLGVITDPTLRFIKYDDGTFGQAYLGRTLSPWYRLGRKWSSRNPKVIYPKGALG